MVKERKPTLVEKIKNIFIGKALNFKDNEVFHSLSLIAFFAWVGLGSDGLSSSSYGPEEAFLALGQHTHLSILVALGSALTVLIISASYTQIIELFPTGGGGYLVASKLLNPYLGMISGCALLIDYVLTITISVASASDAFFSFVPVEWGIYKLQFSVVTLILLGLLNLRGAKESVVPLVPIFLIFILNHAFVIVYAIGSHILNFPELFHHTAIDVQKTHSELGLLGMVFLMLKSYSMGAGTYTGIEAVSNGLPILREPRVRTGKRTMLYMAVSLAVTVFGLMLAYLLFDVHHVPGKTLNAVLFETITQSWPSPWGKGFVWITLFSEALILYAAAQAGFLGGPRVLANMAIDRWFPTRFTLLSDRLVSQNGIIIMTLASLGTMILTHGSVKYLVVLYSITVFITFVLSQLGMVSYWWKMRKQLKSWKRKISINGLGLGLSTFILISVTILKFHDGGWITLLVTGALILLSTWIKRYYNRVKKALKRMDNLVQVANSTQGAKFSLIQSENEEVPKFDPKAKTAVLMVNGFNGLGLHSLFAIIRLFGGVFKNFIFLEVGIIDAGNFKGSDEVQHLEAHVKEGLEQYVQFIRRHGYYAEYVQGLSHDPVSGSLKIAPEILERFPQAIFFMGQLVFAEDTFVTRLFHNNVVFAVQRRLYHMGIPFIILPVRIKMKT